MNGRDVCEFCDGEVDLRVVQTIFRYRGQAIYVDGVPTWVCNKCGERYFDAPVYKRLEEIAQHNNAIKKTICFPLAEYNMAFA